jgi:hypothetical protein
VQQLAGARIDHEVKTSVGRSNHERITMLQLENLAGERYAACVRAALDIELKVQGLCAALELGVVTRHAPRSQRMVHQAEPEPTQTKAPGSAFFPLNPGSEPEDDSARQYALRRSAGRVPHALRARTTQSDRTEHRSSRACLHGLRGDELGTPKPCGVDAGAGAIDTRH